jgi:hypothetical protein
MALLRTAKIKGREIASVGECGCECECELNPLLESQEQEKDKAARVADWCR